MKTSFIGMFTTAFLVSCVLGALLSRAQLPCGMAIKTQGKSKLSLLFRNGTAITNYSWGEFSKGQAKWLDCQLAYTGKDPIEVLWNTTNFPLGWLLRIWVELDPGQKWWSEDSPRSFVPEESLLIQIVLKEVKGTPDRTEFFTLTFIGLSEKKVGPPQHELS